MCKCRPYVRTPFCGRPGCTWPTDYKTFKLKGWIQLTIHVDTEKLATDSVEAERQLLTYIKEILLKPCDIHRVELAVTPKESLITQENSFNDSRKIDDS